jgi:ribosomal protein L7/L12
LILGEIIKINKKVWGLSLKEQEKYTKMLKNIVKETENNKIQTAEDVIKKLVVELANTKPVTT